MAEGRENSAQQQDVDAATDAAPDGDARVERVARSTRRGWGRIALGPRPEWWGAAALLFAATGLLVGWNAADQFVPGVGGALTLQVATDIGLAVVVSIVVTGLLFVTVGRFAALPWTYVATLLGCLIVLLTRGAGASPLGWYAAVAVVVAGSSLLGAALGGLLFRRRHAPARRGPRLAMLALAAVLLAGPAGWLATAGQGPVSADEQGTADHVLPRDPSAPGPFPVTELTYGSGSDPRPEYGADAQLITDSVDVSRTIRGWDESRRELWGFGAQNLPLNARVWAPEGDGPFPLVLLVHGNKSNATRSEDGFGYLGAQLAGHGIIAASVDQNFLNTGVLDRDGGLLGVPEARGLLLLEHLRAWQAWNEEGDNRFAGKVDLGNVGLLGHSRGGEAITTATDLARREKMSGVDIRSLLALAPSDGQYRPRGEEITLRDVNYLTVQGSHDADVVSFGGLNQYGRTTFSGDEYRFASALHIERANHSQFNSRWGRHDVGYGLPKAFLDDDALLSPEQQRRIAALYSTAFFTGTLRGERDMLELFRDHRAAEPWLPDTNYVSRFTDSTTVAADDGAVSVNDGGELTTTPLPLRGGEGHDTVHELSWEKGRTPVVTAPIQAGERPSAVVFDAVVTSPGTELADNVVVRLIDAAGESVSAPLAGHPLLARPLPGQYLVAEWLQGTAPSEPVPQTYRVPLPDDGGGASFASAEIARVELEFTGPAGGVVLLDDIGVAGAAISRP